MPQSAADFDRDVYGRDNAGRKEQACSGRAGRKELTGLGRRGENVGETGTHNAVKTLCVIRGADAGWRKCRGRFIKQGLLLNPLFRRAG